MGKILADLTGVTVRTLAVVAAFRSGDKDVYIEARGGTVLLCEEYDQATGYVVY